MALSASQNKMWVGTRAIGRVYEVTDYGDRRNVRVLVDKLTQPSGVAFANGPQDTKTYSDTQPKSLSGKSLERD